MRLIDKIFKTTKCVLDPGARGGHSPLYDHEVQRAVDLIKRLETMFTT